ncbi:hypothetical protein FRC08_015702 [Ceratobasidium sp. 394]|nr:hypothetical protein FRC08_015702 [Ceratobasidium sp. 394]
MASSSSRVFNIREIVALIFGFVDKPDCVRMCRVSRVAFHAASPFVWEHVEGVYNLLKLFPEAHMTELDFVQGSQYTLFEPDGQVLQPGRFNFYAPFVRRLNIYGKRAVRFGIRGWTYLMRLSTRQTLLPNLVSLDMTTSCKYGWDLALWVRLFASSSVVNVLLIPNPFETAVGISYPVAATILKYLIEHCPHLRNVCLFPDKEASHAEIYDSKGDSLAALLYDQPFHHYLLPTLGIRQLSCSLSVLENENLKALSQLPHLERLTVHAVDEVVESKHPLLPEGSFPSLQFLSLRSNYCGDLTWVLNIRSLLERITTLEVYCDISTNDDTISWTIHRFLPALAHGTVLENLAVDFNADELRDPDDWLLDLGGVLDDSLMTALGPFRRLPLQKISISCMRFPIDPLTSAPHVGCYPRSHGFLDSSISHSS